VPRPLHLPRDRHRHVPACVPPDDGAAEQMASMPPRDGRRARRAVLTRLDARAQSRAPARRALTGRGRRAAL
jgi:hypothetical protein